MPSQRCWRRTTEGDDTPRHSEFTIPSEQPPALPRRPHVCGGRTKHHAIGKSKSPEAALLLLDAGPSLLRTSESLDHNGLKAQHVQSAAGKLLVFGDDGHRRHLDSRRHTLLLVGSSAGSLSLRHSRAPDIAPSTQPSPHSASCKHRILSTATRHRHLREEAFRSARSSTLYTV